MRIFLLLTLSVVAAAAPYEGKVVSTDTAQSALTVLNAKGLTQVMQVSEADSRLGWTGKQVRGDMIESAGKLRLETIFPADPEQLRQVAEVTDALRRETADRGRSIRTNGDLAPAFLLWDQSAKPVSSSSLRGKPYLLNFIFTRCRAAQMCPAATASMASLSKALNNAGLADKVHLISITFDPAYDSPGVLRAYAESSATDLVNHRLLTGNKQQIRDLMTQYGITTIHADGTIVHNAATLLMNAEGRIQLRLDGPRFNSDDLMPILQKQLQAK
jgi:protein SCO1/2